VTELRHVTCPRCATQFADYGHETRNAVVRELRRDQQRLSPKMLADRLGLSIGDVAYHVKVLLEAGVLRRAGHRQRRGATENFYRLAEGAEASAESRSAATA